MADLSMYRVESSNLPVAQKSAIRRIFERMNAGGGLARAKQHAMSTGEGVRSGGESLLVGAALGAGHVYLPGGLDAKMGKMTLPIDGAIGVAGLVASVALAHEPASVDLRNAAASALSVFAFRKTYEFAAKKRGSANGKFAGDPNDNDHYNAGPANDIGKEDPIVAAARFLK